MTIHRNIDDALIEVLLDRLVSAQATQKELENKIKHLEGRLTWLAEQIQPAQNGEEWGEFVEKIAVRRLLKAEHELQELKRSL